MKLSAELPKKIEIGATDVSTVFIGDTRTWSYDPAEDGVLYSYETVADPSFSRWVNNRGQGNSLIAAKMSSGDVSFGGVTWQGILSDGTVAVSNGNQSISYRVPNSSWANTVSSGSYPFVPAFDGFAWAPQTDRRVDITGLKSGERYALQIILADTRTTTPTGRVFEVVPHSGIRAPSTSQRFRYGYTSDNKYAIITMQFTAANESISFFVYTYDNSGFPLGTQINALQLFANVIGRGKTFYVSNSGNDNNDGMSRATPWATTARVNEENFQPGDTILFECGGTWVGTLTPKGNGAQGNPIVLSSYSDGAHPKIDGNGAEWGVIALANQSHWVIDGFEVCSWGTNEAYRHGIRVNNDGGGSNIVIRNNIVRDIFGGRNATGSIPGRHCGGISVWARNGGCHNVIIENNLVHNAVSVGIQIWGPDASGGSLNWLNLLQNAVIRNNVVWGCACDNILYQGCTDILVERNHSGFSGLNGVFPSAIAGLWGTRSFGGIQRFNHSHNTLCWAGAGQSFDAQGLGVDVWMDGTVKIHQNFTHDNQGGPLLDYQTNDFIGGFIEYTYNVSINEPRLTSGRHEDVYHNIFYSFDDVWQLHWGPQNLLLVNNIVVMDSVESVIVDATLSNNVWWNTEMKPENDFEGIYTNPNFVNPLPRLILRDDYLSYAAGGPNTVIPPTQQERRYFGKLKNLTYNTFGVVNSTNYGFWVGRVRALELLAMNGLEACSLNTNIAEHAQGPLLVRIITRNIEVTNANAWLGFLFKNTPYTTKPNVTNTDVDYGILLRESGNLDVQAFKDGIPYNEVYPSWRNSRGASLNHIISFVFTDVSGTGNAFVGNGTRVRMFSDGQLVADHNIDQLNNLYFSYAVNESSWRVRQLYVTSRLSDADAYDDYINMLPATNLLTGVAMPPSDPPLTDFLGKLVDSSLPSVGPFQFNSPPGSENPVPQSVEINGRSLCHKKSVTMHYNYNVIVRDQFFRIINEPCTFEIFPSVPGISVNSSGILSVSPTAASGRYVLKAICSGIVKRFSFEVL
jgi:hypothetical protein